MKKVKLIDVFLDALKALFVAVLAVPTLFLIYRLFESRLQDIANIGNDSYHSGFGLLAFLSAIFLAIVGLCVLALIGISILITRLSKATQRKQSHTRFFLWMLIAPPSNMILYITSAVVIASLG